MSSNSSEVGYQLDEVLVTSEKDACRVRLSKGGEGVTLTGNELKQLSEDAQSFYESL